MTNAAVHLEEGLEDPDGMPLGLKALRVGLLPTLLLSRNLRWLQARSGRGARALPFQERGVRTPHIGPPLLASGALGPWHLTASVSSTLRAVELVGLLCAQLCSVSNSTA